MAEPFVGIAKDLNIDWKGEKSKWWPESIPFLHPWDIPPQLKGQWSQCLKTVLQVDQNIF